MVTRISYGAKSFHGAYDFMGRISYGKRIIRIFIGFYMTPTPHNGIERKGRIIVLAKQVELLLGFCTQLIPYLDLLEETAKATVENHSIALAMAPIFGAMGEDWEEKEMLTKVNQERVGALFELVDTLDRTEIDRQAFYKSQREKKEGLAELHSALGI